MIAYGFPDRDIARDLDIARRLGATVVEIFPDWRSYPDPGVLRVRLADTGFAVHSAHGCWGGQSIRAERVDLGQTEPGAHAASVDDLRRCIDWLQEAGGRCLVVHPGGLSDAAQFDARQAALANGLIALADHARGGDVTVCVENMPPGVFPGSRMADLFTLLTELDRAELAIALDTGHAHIAADVHPETLAAGSQLRTTHVHDNNGKQDAHLPPGHGTIDWEAWGQALDCVGYNGPVMLECIRHFRAFPDSLDQRLEQILARLTRRSCGS
jgi:sugar phosphate isomerase/epimerase